MEKRVTLFIILTVAILIVWFQFVAPPKPRPKPKEGEAPSEAGQDPGARSGPDEQPVRPDPSASEIDPAKIADHRIADEYLALTLTNVGGALRIAELLRQRPSAESEHDGIPLGLLQEFEKGRLSLALDEVDDASLRLSRSLWTATSAADGRSVRYETQLPGPAGSTVGPVTLTKTFSFDPTAQRCVRVRIEASLGGDAAARTVQVRNFRLTITGGVHVQAGESTMTPPRGVLAQQGGEDELTIVTGRDLEKEETISFRGQKRFVADLSNYFGAFFALTDFPRRGTATVTALHPEVKEDEEHLRGDMKVVRTSSALEFRMEIPQGGSVAYEGLLYLGPIDCDILTESLTGITWGEEDGGGPVAPDLCQVYEDQLGFSSFIGKAVLWGLKKWHGVTGNWGWAIVLLTLCVRALLFPVNRRSQGAMMRHSEAMARIKPKVEAIREKYANDKQKLAQEQMALMKAEGVPMVPLGGCLPILLQIPIFFGLFSALRASVSLRGAEWLWVKDLSQPDHFLRFAEPVMNPLNSGFCCCPVPQQDFTGLHVLPILMTIAWVANSMLMPKPATVDPQMEQQRKMMMFMPLLMGVFMYGYAAALSLYWLTSSLVGIVESRVIKKLWPLKGTQAAGGGGTAPTAGSKRG